MARIAGVDIPAGKKVEVALTYIFGVGPSNAKVIVTRAGVNSDRKVKDLTEEELARLREIIDKEYKVEGELRREVSFNIKRLVEVNTYRGLRHRRNLPVRGQRSRSNARSKRGPRKTVAGRGQRRGVGKK